MSARQFSQPNVVHALCLALAKLHNVPELSAHSLAVAVAPKYPGVPLPALQVIAANVLRLYFEPVTIADMSNAGLDLAEEATACEFFGEALMADAVELVRCRDRRDGPNVVPLNTPGQT